jgi:RNA polymerase sigma-70 factor (ECF subfamily)
MAQLLEPLEEHRFGPLGFDGHDAFWKWLDVLGIDPAELCRRLPQRLIEQPVSTVAVRAIREKMVDMPDCTSEEMLLERAAAGDVGAWGALLTAHEPRLCRMVTFRLDPRLQGRIDASDVIQEVFVQAAAHREDFFHQPPLPLFLWLRGIVSNKLLEVHRHHLGTRMRDAGREVVEYRRASPDNTSEALVARLTGGATGPGTAVVRAEVKVRLHEALSKMDPIDREVLALRHFEQLNNDEAARELGIQRRAAAKRYVRALKRLKELLAELPGGLTELRP